MNPIYLSINISADIAVAAGKMRGQYPFLKTMDAIQLAAALKIKDDAFVTNDTKLRRIKELDIVVLDDYLKVTSEIE